MCLIYQNYFFPFFGRKINSFCKVQENRHNEAMAIMPMGHFDIPKKTQ